MSVALAETALLRRMLVQERRPVDAALSRAFFKACARIIRTPWDMATAEAYRFPQTQGERPTGLSILHPYVEHVSALSGTDVAVYRAFLDVMHLLKPPTSLFSPRIAGKVLLRALTPAQR
jgi:hypothetical protein